MREAHGRKQLLATAAFACVTVLTACTAAGGSPVGQRRVLPAGAAVRMQSGTLYLLAGPGPYSTNLWQVELPSGRSRQLTFNPPQYGVSNFSASTAGLVMGDARTGVDEVYALVHGKARLIAGGVGDVPEINNAGQFAFAIGSGPPYKGVWAENRVVLQASFRAPYRTIFATRKYSDGAVVPVSWSPDGRQIMVTESPESNAWTRMFIVSPAGRVLRTLPTLVGDPDYLLWAQTGLAVGWTSSPGPDEVISLSGKVLYRIPGPWVPICWNPAGTELLVGRGVGQHELALWRMSQPGRVQTLGGLPLGGLSACEWISRPATGIASRGGSAR
jgi:hypothetical protein